MLHQVECSDLVPGDLTVAVRERDRVVDGNIAAHELELISKLVKLTDPKTLFEIGTFDGRTTLNLAAHSRPDARVYTLDLPRAGSDKARLPLEAAEVKYIDKPASGERFQAADVATKITQLHADSATFNFRPYYGKVDFLFVDGSHSYPYVLSDSWNALRMVRAGGLIVWHDYVSSGVRCWPGVVQALEGLHATAPAFANLKHVAGTTLAILQGSTPWYRKWLTAFRHARLRWQRPHQTCWHTGLRASLQVQVLEARVEPGAKLSISVRAKNTGKVVWLPGAGGMGGVNLGCHLLDHTGAPVNDDYCHHTSLLTDTLLPGQTISMATQLPTPPRGRYILEFDLVAEGVCWFARNGSKTVRAALEVL